MKYLKPLIILFSLLSPAIGNATNISRAEIPPAVFEGLKNEHPEAKNINVTKQVHFGLTLYEVQFNLHGHPHEALFDASGEPFGHEEPVQQLPEAISNEIQRHFSKYTIENAVSLHHPDGRVEYEIDLRMNDTLWEIVTNENGKILVQEKLI